MGSAARAVAFVLRARAGGGDGTPGRAVARAGHGRGGPGAGSAGPGPPVTEYPAGQNAAREAADVCLPADSGAREQHGELVSEAERHDRADHYVDHVPVEE